MHQVLERNKSKLRPPYPRSLPPLPQREREREREREKFCAKQ